MTSPKSPTPLKPPKSLTVRSAGGFLFDFEKEKVLLIVSHKQYDNVVVPKGKINSGETVEQAAWREVAEETGYDDIEPVAPIGTSDFKYTNKVKNYHLPVGAKVEKIVHYFLFRLKSNRQIMAREGHEDFENIWATFEEAQKLLNYKEDKELLEKAVEIFHSHYSPKLA
jgi:ADP-ribose pyrophosphatase YjhB (NUDIX family)